MILAAGFGTRMLPITRLLPKALLPVRGRTLLEWNLRYLRASGVDEVSVNTHHLSREFERWLEALGENDRRKLPRIRLLHEEEILGTGGGIAAAAGWLASDPVVIMNVDLLFRPDLAKVRAQHESSGARGTLICIRDPRHAQLALEDDRVVAIHPSPVPEDPALWAFTGVYLLSRRAVEEVAETASSSGRIQFCEIVPVFRSWMERGLLGAYRKRGEGRPVPRSGDPRGVSRAGTGNIRPPARSAAGPAGAGGIG